ncbi:MAG TPA: porphobilinogen synthase [Rhabdochlamydiaceae bacterium]|nr:porphobilinogen synthase [Rhabdochlamydiaceae bacterium]
MLKRPRRNRRSPAIRSLIEETSLHPSDLAVPFFILPGTNKKSDIATLPQIQRLSIDHILKKAETLHQKGIQAILLFPCVPQEFKDPDGSFALAENGILPTAIHAIKEKIPSLCVIADLALDPYTSHGHDGLVNEKGEILNDQTVAQLCAAAHIYAQAGADFIAPSDMMDGRVGAIRKKLDQHGLEHVGIISYTAKYASNLYRPFRDALDSAPKFGDKKTYQLSFANVKEALLEAKLDEEEGADILMVKPALFYLDVIAKMRMSTHLPIAAYHVSGEYAMVMAAHEKGYLEAPKVFLEALLSVKRAGADFIFTYAADQILNYL